MELENIKNFTVWNLLQFCWKNKTVILLIATSFAGVVKFVDESVISAHESELLIKDAGAKIYNFIDSNQTKMTTRMENLENECRVQKERQADMTNRICRNVEQIQQILMSKK